MQEGVAEYIGLIMGEQYPGFWEFYSPFLETEINRPIHIARAQFPDLAIADLVSISLAEGPWLVTRAEKLPAERSIPTRVHDGHVQVLTRVTFDGRDVACSVDFHEVWVPRSRGLVVYPLQGTYRAWVERLTSQEKTALATLYPGVRIEWLVHNVPLVSNPPSPSPCAPSTQATEPQSTPAPVPSAKPVQVQGDQNEQQHKILEGQTLSTANGDIYQDTPPDSLNDSHNSKAESDHDQDDADTEDDSHYDHDLKTERTFDGDVIKEMEKEMNSLNVDKQTFNQAAAGKDDSCLGVIAGHSKKGPQATMYYVWTPRTYPGREGTLLAKNNEKLKIGDWIKFKLEASQLDYLQSDDECRDMVPPKKTGRFNIRPSDYEKAPCGYYTKEHKRTLQMTVDDVEVPSDHVPGNILYHDDVGPIDDPSCCLLPGRLLNVVLLRVLPTPGAKTIWKAMNAWDVETKAPIRAAHPERALPPSKRTAMNAAMTGDGSGGGAVASASSQTTHSTLSNSPTSSIMEAFVESVNRDSNFTFISIVSRQCDAIYRKLDHRLSMGVYFKGEFRRERSSEGERWVFVMNEHFVKIDKPGFAGEIVQDRKGTRRIELHIPVTVSGWTTSYGHQAGTPRIPHSEWLGYVADPDRHIPAGGSSAGTQRFLVRIRKMPVQKNANMKEHRWTVVGLEKQLPLTPGDQVLDLFEYFLQVPEVRSAMLVADRGNDCHKISKFYRVTF